MPLLRRRALGIAGSRARRPRHKPARGAEWRAAGAADLPVRTWSIHDGHVEAHRSGLEAVAGLFKILRALLVVIAGVIELPDVLIEIA